MNHRVLELLKTPKNIQSEDLHLLKEEINSFPYVQNIRALYLYGVHLYDKENYQGVLSATAAYTTDKKILYQLINGKIQQRLKPEVKSVEAKEKIIPAENPLQVLYQVKATGFPIKREDGPVAEPQPEAIEELKNEPANIQDHTQERILPPPREEIRHIYVNGARNRILFEGEENFLEDDTVETIDLESTLESGSIVMQKVEKREEPAVVEGNNIQPEKVLQEHDKPSVIKETETSAPETGTETEISSEAEKEETLNKPEQEIPSNEIEDTKEAEAYNNGSENAGEINESEEIAEFTPETIIEEEKISSEPEEEKILDNSALSFHETEAFLPDVQISANENESINQSKDDVNETESPGLNNAGEVAAFTSEKIINEDKISSEKVENTVQDKSELSFHGMESFLPEVKIQANEKETIDIIPQPNLSRHEDEMRRLIQEVEKKMKEKSASEENKKEEDNESTGHDISFAETQHFEVKPTEPETEKEAEAEPQNTSGDNTKTIEDAAGKADEEKAEPATEEPESVRSSWKPMSFDSNLPDSLLNKPAEIIQPLAKRPEEAAIQKEIQNENLEDKEEISGETEENSDSIKLPSEDPGQSIVEEDPEAPGKTKEEAPVMNVSFFGSGWTIPQPEKKNIEKTEAEIKEKEAEKPVELSQEKLSDVSINSNIDSNIPGFINTWQSWLKIDRAEETEKDKTELKSKVIEAFIENNPRISQLKEESNFVIREKGDDISHLMTETLANLYFEQKLYTKAIKAFEILIRKTPEKKKYYEGKIQEIKDFRTKG